MDLHNIWKNVPPGVLDFMLRRSSVRKVALKKGEQALYDFMVGENRHNRPLSVQKCRALMLQNLLKSLDRAFTDGRISPRVSKRLLKNLVGNLFLGETERQTPFEERHGLRPPAMLLISPTRKCNLACKGCYAGSASNTSETMSFEVLDRIIKEKKRLWGSYFTIISGGEPLAYNDNGRTMFDLFEANSDCYFMMYTNGTLIDRKMARRLADHGNVSPSISVEGFEEQTDWRRGKGTYKKILQAFENLRAEGVPFGVSITATRHNAEIAISDEFTDFCFYEQGAVYGWMFQYMPIGRSYTMDLMVTPEQRMMMFRRQERLIREKSIFFIDFWNGGPYSFGCIAAGRPGGYLYIDWDGNVAPCTFFPYYVSNINEAFKEGKNMDDVIMSDYFKAVRGWQNSYAYAQPPDKVGNLITPCPYRDHYGDSYRLVKEFGAKPIDENAAKALEDAEYRERMIQYGREIKDLTQDTWEVEFLGLKKASLESGAPRSEGVPVMNRSITKKL
jgi:MoaA/NifB/PqqE/SkfB family radical SAM enzyme